MKEFGYFISVISVILLAVPAWQNASKDSTLFLCLVAGMIASMLGMVLRWLSYRQKKAGGQGR